ncbi:MAG: 6-phosphofructokinase [Clostridia bacterium]|nr:6-phosphofructokinase [Clostridia bacterium]
MIKNAVVGQSGGPTAAINATLAGVIENCLKSQNIGTLYGAVHGIDGLLKENLINLNDIFEDKSNIELLKVTPSSYLGSCRYRLKEEQIDDVFSVFKKYNIGYFFYIGGNDSMDTVAKLSQKAEEYGVKVIGVPKTIDNDLYGTDHCPGFGSASKYIATSVMEVTRDCTCYDLNSVTIIEIMGRNAGWLTAASALARCNGNTTPDLIYLPERPFIIDNFINDVKKKIDEKHSIVVAISEGIRDEKGNYISEQSAAFKDDSFGHGQLGGAGKTLEEIIKNTLHCKARSIEINLLQRCAAHMLSATDINLSVDIGNAAVDAATDGKSCVMMAYRHKSAAPFETDIIAAPIAGIANAENKVPDEYISKDGNDITDKFIEYAKPLIQGEVATPMSDGLPLHLIRK